jgi:hypothetical protein
MTIDDSLFVCNAVKLGMISQTRICIANTLCGGCTLRPFKWTFKCSGVPKYALFYFKVKNLKSALTLFLMNMHWLWLTKLQYYLPQMYF